MDMTIVYAPMVTRKIRVLVDTGSEVNLIRRGITAPEFLESVKRPLRIAMASHAIMPGGDKEVGCIISITGVERDTKEERTLEIPTTFYEAEIGVEAILSYEWLAMYDFLVDPGMHALLKKIPYTGDIVWFPGNHIHRTEVASVTRVDTPTVMPNKLTRPEKKLERKTVHPKEAKKRRMLDLFSGTGSVGDAFRKLGYEVWSVDVDPRNKPTITVDITIWQYWKCFQPKFFDVIGCCPPCTEFSRAMTSRPRDLRKADKTVKVALEIVEYFQPQFWFLENPRHGELASREYMQNLSFVDVDYCLFSNWGYQKPTRVWGSRSLKNLEPRLCEKNCPNMEWREGRNGAKWVHRSKLGCAAEPGKVKPSTQQAGRVPENLIYYLL